MTDDTRAIFRRLPKMVALVLLISAPAIIAQWIWLPSTAGVFVLGALPATIAAVTVGPHRAMQIAVASGVFGGLAAFIHPYPWAGALLVAAIAGWGGYSARYGNTSPVLFVPIVLAFIVISPPQITDSAGTPIEDGRFPLIVGLALLIGGLWAAVLGLVLTRHLRRAEEDSVPRHVAIGYGIALAVSTGITTFVAAEFFPGTTSPWAVLTILLVLKPRSTDMWLTARHRVGGTLVGAVLAAAVVLVFDVTGLPRANLELLLGAVFLMLALSVLLIRPYWQFVTLLTPAIILLKTSGYDTLSLDVQRVVMTLIGTLLALTVAVVVREVSDRVGRTGQPEQAAP